MDIIIPKQEDIIKGARNEEANRLTLEQLREKLKEEKGGTGSTDVGNLSVDEQDAFRSETS